MKKVRFTYKLVFIQHKPALKIKIGVSLEFSRAQDYNPTTNFHLNYYSVPQSLPGYVWYSYSERNSKCLSEKLKIHLQWKDMQYSFRRLVFCNVMIRQFVSYKSSRTIHKCIKLQNHCPHSKGEKSLAKRRGLSVSPLFLVLKFQYWLLVHFTCNF